MARAIDIPPGNIREWRRDLVAFRNSYVDYLNKTLNSNHPIPRALRSEVVRRAQPAQMVLSKLNADFRWEPPPITQTPPMHGLINTIFVHETPFGGTSGLFNWPKSYEGIIDLVDTSLSALAQMDVQIRRRRRNPLYWGDRVLRALLGFPAYVLSLIFSVPTSRIEESALGVVLRVAAFLVETGVLVLGLNELFDWF
jgi:hypothetical protein